MIDHASMIDQASRSVSGFGLLSEPQAVSVSNVITGNSPRQLGIDSDHVNLLADSDVALPPIIVQRSTMQVVDGAHRLRAADLRGQTEIEVIFFDGRDEDAFVLSVHANTAHGLPLSASDRRIAARNILASHPSWSDRAIASVTGLAHRTVGDIRRRATGEIPQSNTRTGLDRRERMVDTVAARRRAELVLRENPTASLRTVARQVGLSPGTVRDVRDRLREGRDAVPTRTRRPNAQSPGVEIPEPRTAEDIAPITATLRGDPSLRFSDQGRSLLRILELTAGVMTEGDSLVGTVPDHLLGVAARGATGCAAAWQNLAERLQASEQRADHAPVETPQPHGRIS